MSNLYRRQMRQKKHDTSQFDYAVPEKASYVSHEEFNEKKTLTITKNKRKVDGKAAH